MRYDAGYQQMIVLVFILAPVFVYIMFILLMASRRRRLASGEPSRPPAPLFTLAELSAMRATGQITEKEYERLAAAVAVGQGVPLPTRARGFEVIPLPDPPRGGEAGGGESNPAREEDAGAEARGEGADQP